MIENAKLRKKVDEDINRITWRNISSYIFLIVYFGGSIYISYFNFQPIYWIVWFIAIAITIYAVYELNKGLSEKEAISDVLKIISEGVMLKELDEKYLIYLKKKIPKLDKGKFYGKIFESEIERETIFFKNLNEIVGILYYAQSKGSYDQINHEDIIKLARSIEYGNKDILDISYQLNNKDLNKKEIPTSKTKIYKFLNGNLSKFILGQLILFLLLFMAHKYLTKNVDTLVISYSTITAGMIYLSKS